VLAVSAGAAHRSIDGGASWMTISAGQPAAPLYAVARTERSLFLAGASGLFRSRDAGQTWRQVLSGAVVTSLAVGADQTLMAGTESDGILRSDDDGEAWASGNPGLLDLSVLSVAVCEGAVLVGTGSGVYRSVNGGLSWRESPVPCEPASSVECLAAYGRLAVAGTDAAGAFVSTDAGRTWSSVDVSESAVTAVALGGEARMAMGAPGGVYISNDGGRTWRHAATPEVVLSLAFVGEHLLAGVARAGVLRLAPGASSWRVSSDGLQGRVLVDLVRTPSGAFLAADVEDGVQRSTDGGRTWARAAGLSGGAIALAADGERVFAATSEGLYSSADEGCSWTAARAGSAAIAVATRRRLTLAAFEDEQLLVGRDAAWSACAWDRQRGRIVALAVSTDGSMFVGCLAELPLVWRSNDAGRNWSVWLRCPRGASLSLATGEEVLAASDTRVYGLFGATQLPHPVTCISFGAIRNLVYAATTHGAFVSTDNAEHFTTWSDGLPDVPVLSLHASGSDVYALLVGGGLWRRSA
jgi:photosystem II stability/assembly factor-like uncharacterized protein